MADTHAVQIDFVRKRSMKLRQHWFSLTDDDGGVVIDAATSMQDSCIAVDVKGHASIEDGIFEVNFADAVLAFLEKAAAPASQEA